MSEEATPPVRSAPEPSETVKRLRETFAPLAAKLRPEHESAVVYRLEPKATK